MQNQMCIIFHDFVHDQIMLLSHWPHRRNRSYSPWIHISWNKLPITIIHMSIYFFMMAFVNLMAFGWLIALWWNIMSPTSLLGYQLCHVPLLLKVPIERHFKQENLVKLLLHNRLKTRNQWRHQTLHYALLHLAADLSSSPSRTHCCFFGHSLWNIWHGLDRHLLSL